MSLVWKYFSKLSGNKNIVKCNLCSKEIKSSGTTSNLLAHLKCKHLFAFKTCLTKKKNLHKQTSSTENDSDDMIIIDDTNDEQSSSSSRYNKSHNSLTTETSTVSPVPSYCVQPTLLEIINKKKSFENGGSKNTIITEALVYMICRDNMPTRTVEREGFIHLFKIICPKYKLPSRSTLTILIEQKYEKFKLELKKYLEQVRYISLTADICTITNSTRSFLVITSHFINSKTSILESACLGAIHLTERHTAENIVMEFHNICKEFSLDLSKIVSITTDGATNMQKAVELFSHLPKWIRCFAHITNLLVQNTLKSTTELGQIISQIKHIVTYFKHSTIASDALRAEQLNRGKSEGDILYLTQDISTRWNSTLEMLEKFEKLASILATILANKDHKDGPQMLAGSNIEIISEVISLLKPFKEATVYISADKYADI